MVFKEVSLSRQLAGTTISCTCTYTFSFKERLSFVCSKTRAIYGNLLFSLVEINFSLEP